MRRIDDKISQKILDVRREGIVLAPAMIEKDVLVADAVRTVCRVGTELGATIIFCGGTALSQAHGLIRRMSEDADFRLILPPAIQSQSQKRTFLSAIKHKVIEGLAEQGFPLIEGTLRARNMNQYIVGHFAYESVFLTEKALRPDLKLEISTTGPVSRVDHLPLRTIIDRVLDLPVTSLPVSTIAVEDTVVDKIVSFLRRTAQDRAQMLHGRYDDRLVRHLYDIHQIATRRAGIEKAVFPLFVATVEKDRRSFGNQFPAFQEDPWAVLQEENGHVLDAVNAERYQEFCQTMIYEDPPSFDKAARTFQAVANALITRALGERGDQDQGEESGASAAPIF